ncbi:MAG: trigger factor [Desulfovibrio sp.]|jgi:trigger factor|nr:trigger factor [Desulfovibrio sp.]
MQYAIEDLNPVKKKITVTVPAAEVGKAVDEAVSSFRSSLKLDGFRRGKVPAALVMKRFNSEVIRQTTDKLVQESIREIMDKDSFNIVSGVDYDGGLPEPGSDFIYTLAFEVMPEFELPSYEGLEIEQEETVVNASDIDATVLKMRQRLAKAVPLLEDRPPKDGDVAVLDFAALDDTGNVLAGFKAEGFSLTLGEGMSFPGFEDLIKGLAPGEEKEESLAFPEKFVHADLAGRTVRMRVKLKELMEKIPPDEDDAFAQEAGNFESTAKMRESLRESLLRNREERNRAAAQKRLLDKLLEQVEFTVPQAMIESQTTAVRQELSDILGVSGTVPDGEIDAMKDEIRQEAEKRAKIRIFLLAVAKKQGLTASAQDIDLRLRRLARQSGQEFKTIQQYYVRNHLVAGLTDRILADKAMEELYSKARIVPVPPARADGDSAAPETDDAVAGGTDDAVAGGTDDAQGPAAAPEEARPAAEQEADY